MNACVSFNLPLTPSYPNKLLQHAYLGLTKIQNIVGPPESCGHTPYNTSVTEKAGSLTDQSPCFNLLNQDLFGTKKKRK